MTVSNVQDCTCAQRSLRCAPVQAAIARQSSTHTARTCLRALFLFCMVLNLLAATRGLPYVCAITSSLARTIVPLLELGLVTLSLVFLLGMLLNSATTVDERMSAAGHLFSYMMVGVVTGAGPLWPLGVRAFTTNPDLHMLKCVAKLLACMQTVLAISLRSVVCSRRTT